MTVKEYVLKALRHRYDSRLNWLDIYERIANKAELAEDAETLQMARAGIQQWIEAISETHKAIRRWESK